MSTMLGNGLCKLMQWVPQPMLEEYNANGDRKVVGYDDQSQDRFMQLERQLEEQQRGGGVKIGAGLNANDDDRPLPPPPPPRRLAAASTAGQFKCEFEGCGKICFDRASLKKHMQIHGARQYVCTYEGCGKKFQDSSKLKRHFLTHTGEKNHVCTICNKVRGDADRARTNSVCICVCVCVYVCRRRRRLGLTSCAFVVDTHVLSFHARLRVCVCVYVCVCVFLYTYYRPSRWTST